MENKKNINKEISQEHPFIQALRQTANDIRLFIELSLHETDDAWERWALLAVKGLDIKCWEKKNCTIKDCPAYLNMDGRCWLIEGTKCDNKVQGEFAIKYKMCSECEVYKEAVYRDPATEIYEHMITLVHSLKSTQDKLKTMATRDLLTGVYNRNYFNETIAIEIEKTKRYGDRLSIIMIDIDDFKKMNDIHGHLHGDWILKECALILKKAIRSSDFLCRFGGDEFLIVAPKIDCGENGALVKRINEYVSEWNKIHSSEGHKLSLSIGCSVWERDKYLLDVINEADRLKNEERLSKVKN